MQGELENKPYKPSKFRPLKLEIKKKNLHVN
jgi:hypothetical protein